MKTFLRQMLMDIVFLRPQKLLKMREVLCLPSSFWTLRLFCSSCWCIFLCLSSSGVELRFCMSRRFDSARSLVVIVLSDLRG